MTGMFIGVSHHRGLLGFCTGSGFGVWGWVLLRLYIADRDRTTEGAQRDPSIQRTVC